MQTKWEYKTVARTRGWDKDKSVKNASWMVATDWNVEMEKLLITLGDEGWELVAITSRSGYLGGTDTKLELGGSAAYKDYAGFTNSEIWVFKRQKN